ncbi:acetyltransferase (GNAT) family protein [Chitinophaga skermanii]|uniref:Acetyltransferase (GNAT) family protein n=1 Tax=Chitinophaga skermanii TaxID=331697 RepID=A0A327QQD9_9BACT|nr:GNAT family N-acetyltransferase [Chitinophaga skermanii]RAJ06471.1 acetyltransferase (GNAT) family protein [Chitinophaga skermanii]
MDIEIRTLDDSYASQVIDLVLHIQQQEFNIAISIQDQPDLLTIEDFYLQQGGNFWGAFIDGELVGTIALVKYDQHAGAIRKMFVKQAFRGKEYGIAQQLLDVLLAYCKAQGIQQVSLGTVSVLKAAQRFYERNHFEKVEKAALPANFPLMSADNVFYSIQLA